MSDELTDITGIGEELASDLADAGYGQIDEIATADPDELTDVQGIGDAKADSLIDSALEAAVTIEDADVVAGDDPDEGTGAQPEASDTFPVEFVCTHALYPHVLGAVCDEIRDAESVNDANRAETATGAFEALLAMDPGDRDLVEIELTMDELTAFRRGVRTRGRDYRSTGSLADLGSELGSLANVLQEHREANWGE